MEIIPTDYINETLELKNNIEGAFLSLGERLHTIKDQELWKGMYNNYPEFLAELGLSEGQASKLRQIHLVFRLQYGVDALKLARIGQRRLYAIIPLCTDEQTTQRALENIEGLSSTDVDLLSKAEIAGEHTHEDEHFARCTLCKRTKRIYD